jgi:hypothetical protein
MGADRETNAVPAVLAAAPTHGAPPKGEDGPSILITGALLAGTLLLGALLIAALGRWRRRPAPVSPSASDQLAQYRALYEKGAISQEEFDRLRAHLGGQLRQDLNLPPPVARGATAPARQAPADPAGSEDRPPETGVRPA